MRPSRTKASAPEAGGRPRAAIVKLPLVLADARDKEVEEEADCAIERMIGDGLSVFSFPEQGNVSSRRIVQRGKYFLLGFEMIYVLLLLMAVV